MPIIIVLIWIVAIIGYIWNIIKIIGMVNDPITAMLILRAIGTIAVPLGAILGWF